MTIHYFGMALGVIVGAVGLAAWHARRNNSVNGPCGYCMRKWHKLCQGRKKCDGQRHDAVCNCGK